MATIDMIEQFLTVNTVRISLVDLVIALILATVLSYVVGKVYVRYGTALSNREKFSRNFILLATTTTLIITVVKSSLALSLGLVGALSIVRFRAAIKEPEELGFLFLTIAIGLGLGANQFLITIVASLLIALLFVIRQKSYKIYENQNLSLIISSEKSAKITLKSVSNILSKYCQSVHLKRFDIHNSTFESSFFITLDSFNKLDRIRKELESLSKNVKVTYLDRE